MTVLFQGYRILINLNSLAELQVPNDLHAGHHATTRTGTYLEFSTQVYGYGTLNPSGMTGIDDLSHLDEFHESSHPTRHDVRSHHRRQNRHQNHHVQHRQLDSQDYAGACDTTRISTFSLGWWTKKIQFEVTMYTCVCFCFSRFEFLVTDRSHLKNQLVLLTNVFLFIYLILRIRGLQYFIYLFTHCKGFYNKKASFCIDGIPADRTRFTEIQSVQLLQVLVSERKIIHGCVGVNARRCRAFRQWDEATRIWRGISCWGKRRQIFGTHPFCRDHRIKIWAGSRSYCCSCTVWKRVWFHEWKCLFTHSGSLFQRYREWSERCPYLLG